MKALKWATASWHNTAVVCGFILSGTFVIIMIATGIEKAVAAEQWSPPARTHWMKTQCPVAEFATNCAWNAKVQGEGHGGHSYYSVTRKVFNEDNVWNGRRVVCIYYPQRKVDRQFSACHLLPK